MRFILRNNGAAILVEFLLDATFSGVQFTWSFLRERLQCENEDENRLYKFFFAANGIRSQVTQPFSNFSICFSHSKRTSKYVI